MEANRILVPIIAALLLIVAIEGAVLISENNGNPQVPSYDGLLKR